MLFISSATLNDKRLKQVLCIQIR